MKKFLVGIVLLLSMVACGAKYDFVEGPMRISKFRVPFTVETEQPYEIQIFLAGVLYKDPVAVRVLMDGELVGESRFEGFNSRMGTVTHVIPKEVWYLKARRYRKDPSGLDQFLGKGPKLDREEPAVKIRLEIWTLKYEDGAWQLGRRLDYKERDVKLTCISCIA